MNNQIPYVDNYYIGGPNFNNQQPNIYKSIDRLNNRMNRLERQIKILENRVNRLANNDSIQFLNNEFDDNMYML